MWWILLAGSSCCVELMKVMLVRGMPGKQEKLKLSWPIPRQTGFNQEKVRECEETSCTSPQAVMYSVS